VSTPRTGSPCGLRGAFPRPTASRPSAPTRGLALRAGAPIVRLAVEVELHAKAERLAEPDGKLAGYRAAQARGQYAEVLWPVPDAAVGGALARAIERTGCGPFMAIEHPPADVLRYAR
jgi:hypothetical protein